MCFSKHQPEFCTRKSHFLQLLSKIFYKSLRGSFSFFFFALLNLKKLLPK